MDGGKPTHMDKSRQMSTNTETKLKQFHRHLLLRIGELDVMETGAYEMGHRGEEVQHYIARQEVVNVEKAFHRHFPRATSSS